MDSPTKANVSGVRSSVKVYEAYPARQVSANGRPSKKMNARITLASGSMIIATLVAFQNKRKQRPRNDGSVCGVAICSEGLA